MKKIFLAALFMQAFFSARSQTAVDFSASDCNGNNHGLFSELDAGKVVILCWVMPCSSCLSTALAIQANIQSFNNSYPGVIKYYVVDDYANTSCTTLQSWCSSNGVSARNAEFSSNTIKMTDYGANAMPKTVILAGQTHSVFLTQDGALVGSTFTAALSQAINVALTTGIEKNIGLSEDMGFYPNPASEKIFLKGADEKVNLQMYSASGIKVFDGICEGSWLSVSAYSPGLYFLKINGNKAVKFCIVR